MATSYSRAFDVILSTVLAILAIYLFAREPTPELPSDALSMLAMFYLGLLLVCAYFARERLLLFRALSFVAEHLSYPQRREMAIVYSVVFFGVSAYYFVKVINAG